VKRRRPARLQQAKIDQRQASEEATGQKPCGRKTKSLEEAENKEAKANVTDPDSRIMKTPKGYVQGLNAQAAVTEGQVIVAEDVMQQANDKQQLHPMLEQAEANRQAVGVKETMAQPWPTPAIAVTIILGKFPPVVRSY